MPSAQRNPQALWHTSGGWPRTSTPRTKRLRKSLDAHHPTASGGSAGRPASGREPGQVRLSTLDEPHAPDSQQGSASHAVALHPAGGLPALPLDAQTCVPFSFVSRQTSLHCPRVSGLCPLALPKVQPHSSLGHFLPLTWFCSFRYQSHENLEGGPKVAVTVIIASPHSRCASQVRQITCVPGLGVPRLKAAVTGWAGPAGPPGGRNTRNEMRRPSSFDWDACRASGADRPGGH